MSADVKILKPEEHRAENVIAVLRSTLARAEAGEIIGLIMIAEERGTSYEYTRCTIGYEKAIGLCARAQWILNQEWDKTK